MLPAAPIPPKQWSGAYGERMKQDADSSRLSRLPAVPLTLRAPATASALANARCIDQTETAVAFSSLFGCRKRLPSRTMQRSIWLQHKVAPREAVAFEGQRHLGWRIACGRRCVRLCRWKGRRKFRGAEWLRLKLMPHLETEVPNPLTDDLPELLTQSLVRAPAIRILLQVFVGERILEGPTM